MELTHKFKLVSGPECEIKELTGKHQRILSTGGGANFQEKLNEVLKDVIVRIGSVSSITDEVIENLLSADRRKILIQLRQFSLDNDPVFKFNYEYEDGNKMKQQSPQEVDLSEGFPEHPFSQTWTELKDIEKEIEVELPKTKKIVRWKMLDGKGEYIGSKVEEKDLSTHTAILMRYPRDLQENDKGTKVPINMDERSLDKLPYKDIETLRASIKRNEGRIDTEIIIKHPITKKEIIVDVINTQAFFFPSEVM